MRLIDADKLEEDLKKYLKTQEAAAEHYNITDGTYVKLQRGVMFTVLEMVQAQPEVLEDDYVAVASVDDGIHFDKSETKPWGFIASEATNGFINVVFDITEIKKVSNKDFLQFFSVLKKIKND